MSVNAVTPLVPASTGRLQYYRDLDHVDVDRDLLATGEDIFSDEWPDRPLRLNRRGTPDPAAAARERGDGVPGISDSAGCVPSPPRGRRTETHDVSDPSGSSARVA